MRRLLGADYRFLLPASALAGAGMLLVSDILCHVVVSPLILPISAITSFVGRAYFHLPVVSWGEPLMLAACGLGFSYRAGTPVLRDVSIELARGSFTAILGVNGCGKLDASVMPDGTPKARCGAGVPRCVP